MSRIILSKHDDGTHHVVVGWDHPAAGAFWQEFGTVKEVAEAEAKLDDGNETYEVEVLAETGVKREGGMWPGIALDKLVESMPEELQPLVTDRVMELLLKHAEDPDSGCYRNLMPDLT